MVRPSAHNRHYRQTKENVLSLRPAAEAHVNEKVLTHIDAVPDNFLFVKDENGNEDIRLIDWEYAECRILQRRYSHVLHIFHV